jgi:hypothetical protein
LTKIRQKARNKHKYLKSIDFDKVLRTHNEEKIASSVNDAEE